MLELIFVDLPLLLLGYAGAVYLILKYLGEGVNDVSGRAISKEVAGPTVSRGLANPKYAKTEVVSKEPLISIEVEADSEINFDFLPTDAQLRRHYLTHLLTIATSIHPRPAESVLKRHQRQRVLSLVEDMLRHPETIESLEATAREQCRIVESSRQTLAPIAVNINSMPSPTLDLSGHASDRSQNIPEESTLRRHFIQHFVAKLEDACPRPTESTLSRHYDQWLQSEVDNLVFQSG
jgi:hypothetical protein